MTTKSKTGKKKGNGEGTIRQRADGSWEGRISLPNGERKSVYGRTRRDVSEKTTTLLRDVQQGLPVPTGRLTLGAFLQQWLEEAVKPSVREQTYISYSQIVRNHVVPTLGRLPLPEVTPQRIQALLNAKLKEGKAPRTVGYVRAVLRRALSVAVKWNLIARNPVPLVDAPKQERREMRAFSPAEARRFLTVIAGDPLEALYTVAVTLGLREGEVLGLRWSEIDLDANVLAVRRQVQNIGGQLRLVDLKTDRSRRTLPLPGTVATALRAHRTRQLAERLRLGAVWQENDLVFPSAVGTMMDARNMTRRFKALLARAGLAPMRFHDLRHSAASIMLAQGVDLRTIMEVLGHSQIGITMNLYAHVGDTLKRDAASKMEAFLTGTDG